MRPTLREPYPVRVPAVLAGLAGAGAWLAGFGTLAADLAGYAWWTLGAGAAAWLAALALLRHGDRGVAAGIAVALAIGWSSTAVALGVTWVQTGTWPLW
ncbi:hypothetical protein HDA40_004699 [Hamadaea flava]|uniref:Uncharacterized protein n=1 Tax=Hamadaea flava TaxID=1742688 RepID=A0ABV8LG26_9ACTN|nr:hypothetical protein [Hamadaea flava]MCP2326192.1 hypothetical protein [Hamadaea flava]